MILYYYIVPYSNNYYNYKIYIHKCYVHTFTLIYTVT